MTTVFLLRDLEHNYLSKAGTWGPVNDENLHKSELYHTLMKDEAINQKVELIVKNPALRIQLEEASMDQKGKLTLEYKDERIEQAVNA